MVFGWRGAWCAVSAAQPKRIDRRRSQHFRYPFIAPTHTLPTLALFTATLITRSLAYSALARRLLLRVFDPPGLSMWSCSVAALLGALLLVASLARLPSASADYVAYFGATYPGNEQDTLGDYARAGVLYCAPTARVSSTG